MRTRNIRTLPCSHTFHSGCLQKWKQQGNYTCPMCREDFDPPQYKVSIHVEYLRRDLPGITFSPSRQSSDAIGQNLITADMDFQIEDTASLRNVLSDLGLVRPDFNILEALIEAP